jgi:hypothetical protein
MWAKAFSACEATAPESGTCETKPIFRQQRVGRGQGRGRRGKMCETNPIRPGQGRDGSPASERCETNPICRPPRGGRRGQSCETKPIAPPEDVGRDAQPTKRRGAIVRNEPNFRRRHVGRGQGAWDAGQMCETNPIRPGLGSPSRRAKDAKRTQFAAGRTGTGGTNRAKQSQLAPERNGGQVFGRKGVMMNWTRKRLRQNKANSRRWRAGRGRQGHGARANCAKRTQFPAMPGGRGPQGRGMRGNRAKQSQFPSGGTRAGASRLAPRPGGPWPSPRRAQIPCRGEGGPYNGLPQKQLDVSGLWVREAGSSWCER